MPRADHAPSPACDGLRPRRASLRRRELVGPSGPGAEDRCPSCLRPAAGSRPRPHANRRQQWSATIPRRRTAEHPLIRRCGPTTRAAGPLVDPAIADAPVASVDQPPDRGRGGGVGRRGTRRRRTRPTRARGRWAAPWSGRWSSWPAVLVARRDAHDTGRARRGHNRPHRRPAATPAVAPTQAACRPAPAPGCHSQASGRRRTRRHSRTARTTLGRPAGAPAERLLGFAPAGSTLRQRLGARSAWWRDHGWVRTRRSGRTRLACPGRRCRIRCRRPGAEWHPHR